MSTKELRQMTIEELYAKLSFLRVELQKRFNIQGVKSKNVKEVFNIKKDVARILTIIKEKSNGKEK